MVVWRGARVLRACVYDPIGGLPRVAGGRYRTECRFVRGGCGKLGASLRALTNLWQSSHTHLVGLRYF